MAKQPCCWASNELSRDKENYIRCSTRQNPPPPPPPEGSKGKKQKKPQVCCATAFRMKQKQDREQYKLDMEPNAPDACGKKKKGEKKKKADKAKFRCFTANMICMKLYMPGRDFECFEQLGMIADICKGCKPVMCSDRINVNCFPKEPSANFSMLSECFERELDTGIQLKVIYMKKEIGRGCYALPESVIQRMVNTFDEVVHTAEVELTCKGCTVGMATVRLSMRMMCQQLDFSGNGDDDVDDGDMCGGGCRGGMLNSQDSTSDPCLGFVSLSTPSCPLSCSERDRGQRAKGGAECTKLIDMAGPFDIYDCEKTGCIQVGANPKPAKQFAGFSGHTNRLCPKESAPKLKEMGIKVERECPVCKEDVTWLPLVSACPTCGYKPLPVYEEKEYNEETTANQIITEYFEDIKKGPELQNQPPSVNDPCMKTSKASEGFDSIIQDYRTLKQSIQKCKASGQGGGISKPASSRPTKDPNLLTVFTELKNMYQSGESNETKRNKIKEICDEACRLAKATRRRAASKKPASHSCGVVYKKRKRAPRMKDFKSRLYVPMEPMAHRSSAHATCGNVLHKVPAHMGWLWTQCPLAARPGWRPGAIRRSIRELMSYFLRDYPVDTIPISKYMSYHKQKPPISHEGEERPEELVQVPTLHIEKRNNEYVITLRPLKDAEGLKRAANPYVKMKPIQFRIVKNPLLKEVREMKRCLKNMGYSKCQCHRPVMECYCRSFIDKKLLVDDVRRQCALRKMPCCERELVLSDTTDSEAEFDFGVTPPAGLMKPERLKITHMTHTETQYNENDWAMPTMFPHPPNAYVQYGGCVTGERKNRFNWIFGKGNVHEVPKPPKMINKGKEKPVRKFHGAPLPPEVKRPFPDPKPVPKRTK